MHDTFDINHLQGLIDEDVVERLAQLAPFYLERCPARSGRQFCDTLRRQSPWSGVTFSPATTVYMQTCTQRGSA